VRTTSVIIGTRGAVQTEDSPKRKGTGEKIQMSFNWDKKGDKRRRIDYQDHGKSNRDGTGLKKF